MDEEDMRCSLIHWLPLSIQDMINCVLLWRKDYFNCLPETEPYLNMGTDNQQAISLKSSVFLVGVFFFSICMYLGWSKGDSELGFSGR